MSTIYKRRSIRSYTDQLVSKEDVLELCKAGMNAPSGMNLKPYRFLVIDDRKTLDDISTMTDYSIHTAKSNVSIAVLADKDISPDWWISDGDAATMNILNRACELGLGACWLGFYPVKEHCDVFKEYFKLADNLEVISVISIGYPIKEKPANDYFNEELIYFNEVK